MVVRHTDLLMVIAWLSLVECTANLNEITKNAIIQSEVQNEKGQL